MEEMSLRGKTLLARKMSRFAADLRIAMHEEHDPNKLELVGARLCLNK